MASKPLLRVELSIAKDAIADAVLKATPAKVRRIIRGSMGKATRASAKRVKQNVKPNKRTGQLGRAEGQKVETYGQYVVGMVGARTNFRIVDPTYGPVNPANYDHLLEGGRVIVDENNKKGTKWLVLRFPTIAKLRKFLDRRFGSQGSRKISRRTPAPFPEWTQLARRYGRFIAGRIRKIRPPYGSKGFAFFLRKVGPAAGRFPVTRDAENFGADADRFISQDIAARL